MRPVCLCLLAILDLATPAGAQPWMDRDRACDIDIGDDIIVRLVGVNAPVESAGIAFRLTTPAFWVRYPKEPPTGQPLPPLGCPGNPVVAESLGFPFQPVGVAGIPNATVERLALYGHDGPVGIQRNNLKLLEYLRRRHGPNVCNIIGGVLEACRSCSNATSPSSDCPTGHEVYKRFEVPAAYRALPGTYVEHEGLPFAGDCSWPRSVFPTQTVGRPCEFRYQLEHGPSVAYRIDDALIPEEAFIAFDREVRRQILAARMPLYD